MFAGVANANIFQLAPSAVFLKKSQKHMTYTYRVWKATYHLCMNINFMTSSVHDKSEQYFKITTLVDNEMLFRLVYS